MGTAGGVAESLEAGADHLPARSKPLPLPDASKGARGLGAAGPVAGPAGDQEVLNRGGASTRAGTEMLEREIAPP